MQLPGQSAHVGARGAWQNKNKPRADRGAGCFQNGRAINRRRSRVRWHTFQREGAGWLRCVGPAGVWHGWLACKVSTLPQPITTRTRRPSKSALSNVQSPGSFPVMLQIHQKSFDDSLVQAVSSLPESSANLILNCEPCSQVLSSSIETMVAGYVPRGMGPYIGFGLAGLSLAGPIAGQGPCATKEIADYPPRGDW